MVCGAVAPSRAGREGELKTALVFARMDSRRLPGKALIDLGGKPMLDRVIDRVSKAAQVGRIVVATSDRPVDDPIAAHAEAAGVTVSRGQAEDVVGRALACARALGLDVFIRISGDSPFLPPEVIDEVCELYDAADPDLATNVHPRSFPAGCSVEVLRVATLAEWAPRMDAADREHVTTCFYRASHAVRIVNLRLCRTDLASMRLTVDDNAELRQARWIVAAAGRAPEELPLGEIVALARSYEGAGAEERVR